MGRSRLDISGAVVRAGWLYLTKWELWLMTALVIASPVAFLAARYMVKGLIPPYWANSLSLLFIGLALAMNLFLLVTIQSFTYGNLAGSYSLGDSLADAIDRFLSVLMATFLMVIFVVALEQGLLTMLVLVLFSGKGCNVFFAGLISAIFLLVSYLYLRASLYKQYGGIYEEAFWECFKKSWNAFDGLKGFLAILLLAFLHAPLILLLPSILLSVSILTVSMDPFMLTITTIVAVAFTVFSLPMYVFIQILSTIFAATATEGYDPVKKTFSNPIKDAVSDLEKERALEDKEARRVAASNAPLPAFAVSASESAELHDQVRSFYKTRNAYSTDISPLIVPNALRSGGTSFVPAMVLVDAGNTPGAADRFRRMGLHDLPVESPLPIMVGEFVSKGKGWALLCIVERGSAKHMRVTAAAEAYYKSPGSAWQELSARPLEGTPEEVCANIAQALMRLAFVDGAKPR